MVIVSSRSRDDYRQAARESHAFHNRWSAYARGLMYDPVKDGVAKTVESVFYAEAPPPAVISELVHCFWEMRTETDLVDDFTLHAMPDACVNLLFNQRDTRIAGVTQLHTSHRTLDLGRSFHYAGIQFFPGVWRGDPDASVDHYVGEPYEGDLPLVEASEAAAGVDFNGKAFGQHDARTFRRVQQRRAAGSLVLTPNRAGLVGVRFRTPCTSSSFPASFTRIKSADP